METYACNLCPATYQSNQSLNRHIQCKHPADDSQKFACVLCKYTTHRADRLKRHQSVHERENKVSCALCDHRCPNNNELLHHYTVIHGKTITEENHVFSDESAFYEWKHKLEKETNSEFVRVRGQWATAAGEKLTFKCHRDGEYKPRGSGLRHIKILGSNKIGGHCPSSMNVTFDSSGEVNVSFCSTHVGHQPEIGRLRLSKLEREEIAKKIAIKIPFDLILDGYRYNIEDSSLQRLNLLSRKDIQNIAQSFNLQSEAIRHSNDCTSVESWVKEMQETGSVVQFYKPQGIVNEKYHLGNEDFLLIIMNEAQIDMLRKFGSNCVCIDSTHGLNEYGFELTTLMVLDELWQGFPCAFMFCNRGDQQVMEIFFSVIKEALQFTLETDVLMSDMAEVFFNAWCQVMTPPKNRLYCSWHIDRAWRKNLCKVKGRESQTETYKIIRTLMEYDDRDTFQGFLEEAIQHMKTDPDIADFGLYFEKMYKTTATYWAHCFRQHKGINTNMHLERMHGIIKHIYLKGKKPKRLDIAIYALMRYLRDKLYDRLLHLNKGRLTSKISALRQRHKTSLQLSSDHVVCGNGEWEVASATTKQTYVVKKLQGNPCSCELRCIECRACIHRYICGCLDSAIKFNMCKHIHLICRIAPENDGNGSESSNTDLVVCEPSSGEIQKILIKELQSPGTSIQCGTFEQRREQIMQRFIRCLDEAKSIEDLEVINKCLNPVMPTLKASQSSSTLPALSLGKVANCEPQKRFVATKRKRGKSSLAIRRPDLSEREEIIDILLPKPQAE